jgi:hypothetical protein
MSEHIDRVLPADLPPWLVDEATMLALLGVADLTPEDENAMATATALIQRYVDRMLVKATYTERHFGARIGSIKLLEWPVEEIISLRSGSGDDPVTWSDVTGWRLVRPTGIVLGVWGCDVEAVYTAGYDPMPADIQAAFLATFRMVRAAGADETGLGLARRVAVTDVGSVEYDFGGGAGSVTGSVQPHGLLPATAVALLAPHCYQGSVGVG